MCKQVNYLLCKCLSSWLVFGMPNRSVLVMICELVCHGIYDIYRLKCMLNEVNMRGCARTMVLKLLPSTYPEPTSMGTWLSLGSGYRPSFWCAWRVTTEHAQWSVCFLKLSQSCLNNAAEASEIFGLFSLLSVSPVTGQLLLG